MQPIYLRYKHARVEGQEKGSEVRPTKSSRIFRVSKTSRNGLQRRRITWASNWTDHLTLSDEMSSDLVTASEAPEANPRLDVSFTKGTSASKLPVCETTNLPLDLQLHHSTDELCGSLNGTVSQTAGQILDPQQVPSQREHACSSLHPATRRLLTPPQNTSARNDNSSLHRSSPRAAQDRHQINSTKGALARSIPNAGEPPQDRHQSTPARKDDSSSLPCSPEASENLQDRTQACDLPPYQPAVLPIYQPAIPRKSSRPPWWTIPQTLRLPPSLLALFNLLDGLRLCQI